MIKRIIMSVLCIALVISSFSGCAFAAAKKGAENAPLKDGSDKGNGGDVEGVSVVGGEGSLLSYNGEYILTGNVTITKENASENPTYQALLSVFDGKHLDTERKILNGQGYTIDTEIPLFKVIGNCNIKNLNVISTKGIVATSSHLAPDVDGGNTMGLAVIASVAHNPVIFENVNVDADLTFTSNVGTNGLCVGAFVGYGGVYRMTNCKNDGDITVTPGSCGLLTVGGIIGYKEDSCAILYENCVNNGNIVAKKAGGASVDMYAGGIAGCSKGNGDVINNSMNTGNITAEQDVPKHTRIGGLVGHHHWIIPTDCMNFGDISVKYVSSSDFMNYDQFMIGGIVGSGYKSATFKRCLNTGDITCVTTGGAIRPSIGGIVSWRASGNTTFLDCVNIGKLPTNSFVVGGITPHNNMSQTILNNCYTVAFAGEWTPYYNQNQNGVNSDRYFITVPTSVDAYIEKVKTEQINDAETVIKTVLEMVEYDNNFPHDKDDGKTLKSTVIG